MKSTLFIWALCCVSVYALPQSRRPAYVECVSSSDCSFDSCCELGMGRFSIPSCQKKQQLYQPCRPASNESINSTVAYLDGQVVSLYDVYLLMCPCADGLVCDPKTGRCEDFDGHQSVNEIYENNVED